MAANPEFRFRVDPDLFDWLKSLDDKGSKPGEFLARNLLEAVREACGDKVPESPLEFSLSIALKRGGVGSYDTARELRAAEGGATPAAPPPTGAGILHTHHPYEQDLKQRQAARRRKSG